MNYFTALQRQSGLVIRAKPLSSGILAKGRSAISAPVVGSMMPESCTPKPIVETALDGINELIPASPPPNLSRPDRASTAAPLLERTTPSSEYNPGNSNEVKDQQSGTTVTTDILPPATPILLPPAISAEKEHEYRKTTAHQPEVVQTNAWPNIMEPSSRTLDDRHPESTPRKTTPQTMRQDHIPSAAPSSSVHPQVTTSAKLKNIHADLLHSVSRQVQTWVASQPALFTSGQRELVARRVVEQTDHALRQRDIFSKVSTEDDHVAMSPEPSALGQAEYHVHLAVGPVSVLLTQPENKAKSNSAVAVRDAANSNPGHFNRLRRHYLYP